jgi:hypothetical protein
MTTEETTWPEETTWTATDTELPQERQHWQMMERMAELTMYRARICRRTCSTAIPPVIGETCWRRTRTRIA